VTICRNPTSRRCGDGKVHRMRLPRLTAQPSANLEYLVQILSESVVEIDNGFGNASESMW